MGLSLRNIGKKIQEVASGAYADANLWDGGKSHGNRKGAPRPAPRPIPQNIARPAQTNWAPGTAVYNEARIKAQPNQSEFRAPPPNMYAAPSGKPDYPGMDDVRKAGLATALGAVRSGTGTAQGLSGLYDWVSPGRGTNRYSKKLDTFAKRVDQTAKDEGVDNMLYHGSQGVFDAAQFLTGAGAFKAAGQVASKSATISKAASKLNNPLTKAAGKYLDDVANKVATKGPGGRIAAKSIKAAKDPSQTAENLVETGLFIGQDASKGKDISPGSVGQDLALGSGFQFGLPALGQASREIGVNGAIDRVRQADLARQTYQPRQNNTIDPTKIVRIARTGHAAVPENAPKEVVDQLIADGIQPIYYDSPERRKWAIATARNPPVAQTREEIIANARANKDQAGFVGGGNATQSAQMDGIPFIDPITGKRMFEGDDSGMDFQPDYDGIADLRLMRNQEDAELRVQALEEKQKKFFEGSKKFKANSEELKKARHDLEMKTKVNKPRRLEEVIRHDKLFEAYPQLRDLKVILDPNMADTTYGSFDGTTMKLNPNKFADDDGVLDTVLHEIGHKLQKIEGQPGGGSLGDEVFASRNLRVAAEELENNNPILKDLRAEILEKRPKTARELNDIVSQYGEDGAQWHKYMERAMVVQNQGKQMDGYGGYMRLYGEMLSRNQQNRRKMTMDQRRKKPFNDTFDMPVSEAIYEHDTIDPTKPVDSVDDFEFGDDYRMSMSQSKNSKADAKAAKEKAKVTKRTFKPQGPKIPVAQGVNPAPGKIPIVKTVAPEKPKVTPKPKTVKETPPVAVPPPTKPLAAKPKVTKKAPIAKARPLEDMGKPPVGSKGKNKVTSRKPKDYNTPAPIVDMSDYKGSKTDAFGEKMIDKDAVIINLFKKIDQKTGLKTEEKFKYLSNMQRSVPKAVEHDFVNNKGVHKAIGGLKKKEMAEFQDYAVARRELQYEKSLKTSRSREELQATVDKLDAKFNDRYSGLNDYYQDLAVKARDAGVITPKRFAMFKANKDYIRLQRDMDDLANQNPGGGGGKYSLSSTVTKQKVQGSNREAIDVVATALDYGRKIETEVTRNTTGIHLVDTLSKANLARRVSAKQAQNKNVINIFRNGKQEHWVVPQEIKRVADEIDPFTIGKVGQVIGAPGRLLRATATALNPVFTASNVIKDQIDSVVLSKNAVRTHDPRNIASGLKNSVQDFTGFGTSPLFNKFDRIVGTTNKFDLNRNQKRTGEIIDNVRGGRAAKTKNASKHLLRTFEDANSITERSTRFQSFKGMYDDAVSKLGDDAQKAEWKAAKTSAQQEEFFKKHKKLDADAEMQAGIGALENTINFGRAGSWGRNLNLIYPYLNANIQGSRQLVKSAKERPVATGVKAGAYIGVPIIAATLWNTEDPERRKIYENIDDYEKENNIIIIKPGTKYDDVSKGSYGVIKIPLAPGFGKLLQPIRHATEAAKGVKSESNRIHKTISAVASPFTGPIDTGSLNGLTSSLTPQAAKPAVNQGMNRDLYTGKPIVPDYLKESQTDPKKRVTPYTSSISRIVGEKLGTEPVRVDKAIYDTTSKVGQFGVNAVDRVLAATGKGKKDDSGKPIIGGQSVGQGFEGRFGKASAQVDPTNKAAAYFKKFEAETKNLNATEKAAVRVLKPIKVDGVSREKTLYDASLAASLYKTHPKVLDAMNRINKGKNGDPFFNVPKEQQQVIITLNTLSDDPGNITAKKLMKDNPWIQDYYDKRGKFFDGLEKAGTFKGKPGEKSTLPKPPEQTTDLKAKLETLKGMTEGKSTFIQENQDLQDYFTAQDDYTRKKRDMLGLPQFDRYPKPTPEVQKKLDLLNSLPKGDGKKGGNKSRSDYIKANPEIGAFFDAATLFALGEDAKNAVFETEGWSEKTLSKLGMGEGGSSSGGSGYSKGSSKYPKNTDTDGDGVADKHTPQGGGGMGDGTDYNPFIDTESFRVSTTAKKPSVSFKSPTIRKSGRGKVAFKNTKMKVTKKTRKM